jgi:hypothetical protein
VTARIVAASMGGKAPPVALDGLSPDRFTKAA